MNNQKNKVLVIEDDADQRILLEILLSELGYAPISYHSPDQLISKIEDPHQELVQEYCAIICDIRMPRINGFDLVRSAYERLNQVTEADAEPKLNSFLPVLFITADNTLTVPEDLAKHGCRLLFKDSLNSQLKKALSEL